MKHNTTNQPIPTPISEGDDKGYTPGEVHIYREDFGSPKIKFWNSETRLCSMFHDNGSAEAKANAARIVECWNNYDRLKEQNEKLAWDVNKFAVDNKELKEECEKLLADKKELIEILEMCQKHYNEVDGSGFIHGSTPEFRNEIESAIAKHQTK